MKAILLRPLVALLLILWASARRSAIGPTLVYGAITLGFGFLLKAGGLIDYNIYVNALLDTALSCLLFWMVCRTKGLLGWLARASAFVILGGVAGLAGQWFGK